MTKRGRCRAKTRHIKEDSNEEVVVLSIHDACVELTYVDEGVKTLDRGGGPNGMNAVWKEDRPKSGRLSKRKDNDAGKRR